MKAIVIQNNFGLENISIVERPIPEPKAGEILLKMKASSLNYRDLMTISGKYNPKQPLPLIPCSDGVGEVVSVGENVGSIQIGDRVATTFFQDWQTGEASYAKTRSTLGGPLDGTLAEYMTVKEFGCIPIPNHLNDTQASTLPCAGLTAWNAVVTLSKLKAGQTVVIQGTGGVALFALQFAKIIGARVIITSKSDQKLEQAKKLGADVTINYNTTPEWAKEVLKSTQNTGCDLVIELGGAGTFEQSLQACRIGGCVAQIGVLGGANKEINLRPILMKSLHIQGIFVGNREQFQSMNQAIIQNKMLPIVDKVFSLSEIRQALDYMGQGQHFGKVCIAH